MKHLYIVLAICAGLALIYYYTQFYNKPQGVNHRHVHFDQPDQSRALSNAEIVLFFSETCPPCQAMKPNWNSARSQIEQDGIKVTEFAAQRDMETILKYGISGFPTIYFFPNGRENIDSKVIYAGDRSVESIIKFARSGGKMD